jgi:transmembrane sensor
MQDKTNLFKKYINNECNSDEMHELLGYFGGSANIPEFELLIDNQLKLKDDIGEKQQKKIDQYLSQTDRSLKENLFIHPKKLSLHKIIRYAIAASILLIASIAILSVYFKNSKADKFANNLNKANIIRDKAYLKLADGSVIDVSSGTSDILTESNKLKISKAEDGTITYSMVSNDQVNPNDFNELTTPKGAKVKVILPDGTRVWLNAESTIKYPVAFNKVERIVQLNGEAYFEVEKLMDGDKRVPFKVKTDKQTVEVLGTEFNVNSYSNQDFTKTTLIKGKVNVTINNSNQQIALNPGDQAVLSVNGSIKVLNVIAENAIAWKNGQFLFDDEHLTEILKQFSRWYNVEVDYNNVPDTHFNMLISRNESLKGALNMLEKTGHVKMRLIENKIIINQ